jgi:mannan endo-1,4-beta-mannosidase
MKNHFFTFVFISLFCLIDFISPGQHHFPFEPDNNHHGVQRPHQNRGTGFFVRNGKIYDNRGRRFIIRGVNHTCFWGYQERNLEAITSDSGIVKSGANAVRLIFPRIDDSLHYGMDEVSEKRVAIAAVIAKRMVPIITYTYNLQGPDRTSTDFLRSLAIEITQPAMRNLLRQYESKIILNIANEWGNNDVAWRTAYMQAIRRIRHAGINCLIMIDAGGNFGQNPNSLADYARPIFNSDLQRNIVFALHMYAYWVSPSMRINSNRWFGPEDQCTSPNCPPYDIETQLTRLQTLQPRVPIVIGEFSWEGCLADNLVAYKTRELMQVMQQKNIGWLAWSWYQNAEHPCLDMLKKDVEGNPIWLYRSDADLTDFGNLIINNPDVGLKATARRPNIF